jgi:predicted GIY-YIG superfamily endonuclease
MQRLYVLELKHGKYYVGTTNDLQKRFQEHVDGTGAVWTRKYAPLAIERSVMVDGPLHEDRVTKELMLKYGIDNVRGGSYCRIDLDDGQYQSLTTELRSATGVCFKCGLPGHFAAQCHHKAVSTKEDKKSSHGHLNTMSKKGHPKTVSRRDEGCFRCRRSGHFANTCYARTDVDGYLLSESSEEDDVNSD